ncbi:MAG TPA: ribonuclease [Sphingomonadaceae bacterium]|jgi:hypothetical protein|nr:ribonuclease [Sphingomonadaceae bacterium]
MEKDAGAVWIVEDGIGETRAALVQDGAILAARVELPGMLRAGTIANARLIKIVAPARLGLVVLPGGAEALLQPLPAGLTEGALATVEVTREAIGHKRALCRAVRAERAPGEGPDLATRLARDTRPVRTLQPHEDDALEEAGWSELLEEATGGTVAFAGGALLIALTPAMTLLDVDGGLAPDELAVTGAAAAGRAIRRLDIAGSIGIDLPTTPNRAARLAAATALDSVLPPPFERTAVNGFGFLQVVRPQQRASLPQMITADPVGAAARAVLRRAERVRGAGARVVHAHPSVIARLQEHPDWMRSLERRTGTSVALRAKPGPAISAWHVAAEHP